MPCTTSRLRGDPKEECAPYKRAVISVSIKKMEANTEDLDDSTGRSDGSASPQWKMEPVTVQQGSEEDPEVVVGRLLQSVTEVQNDYQNLRRELVEVQALQRELSGRLRSTLRQVHGKCEMLRERIAGAPPH